MCIKYLLFVCFSFFASNIISQKYEVTNVSFNSKSSNETNPEFFKGDLYFASDSKSNIALGTSISKRATFKIYARDSRKQDKIFKIYEYIGKKNIASVAFCEVENIAFFTVSNYSKKNNGASKSDIYLSRIVNKWSPLEAFEYNSKSYNIANPCFSKDGKRLYFESDMPGGYGGMDIWYCDREGNKWNKPVNVGSQINSSNDEKTPFIDKHDNLYFSAKREEGLGALDVYVYNSVMKHVVHLPSPINSSFDDFGYTNSGNDQYGYFSSNRDIASYNIYSFKIKLPDLDSCKESIQEKKCFTFYDPIPLVDSSGLGYKWDFGDGNFGEGSKTRYCYEAPGSYKVKMFLFDKKNPNMIDEVSHNTVVVNNPSNYFFDYKDSLELKLVKVKNINKTDELITSTWLYNDETVYYENQLLMPQKKGRIALNAFFTIGDKDHCLKDTVLLNNSLVKEKDTIHVDLRNSDLINMPDKVIRDINLLKLKNHNVKEITVFMSDSMRDLDLNKTRKQFKKYFNTELALKYNQSIKHPFLLIITDEQN